LARAGKSLLVGIFMLFGVGAGVAQGEAAGEGNVLVVESPDSAQILLLEEDKPLETQEAVPAGTYILPEAPGQDNKGEKCMTVCARWGEDCLLINKGAGGMERKCRRTCKQFAEECF